MVERQTIQHATEVGLFGKLLTSPGLSQSHIWAKGGVDGGNRPTASQNTDQNILEFGDKLVDAISSAQKAETQNSPVSAEDQKAVLQKAVADLLEREN